MDLRSAYSYYVEGGPEYPMMLPPSLSSSPNETDIANCYERSSMQPTTTTTTYDDLSPSPTPMLKSKWSSSMIGSIREEHERRGPSARLRLYFGGGGGKRGSKNSKVVPQTPKSPSRTSYATNESCCGDEAPPWILWAWTPFKPRVGCYDYWVWMESGHHGNGVRRRGSVTPMISDVGSDDSALSSASSGFKRKPIPVEMLLKGGA